MAKESGRLTDRQRLFLDEYMIDRNATQAATRAGFGSAEVMGPRLIKRPHIAAAIAERVEQQSERTGITADRVLAEIAKVAFSDLRRVFTPGGNLLPLQDIDDETAACLSSIEIVTRKVPGGEEAEVEHVAKIKLWDKMNALEKLGKHLGLFADKVEHTGKDGGPIEINDRELAKRIAMMLTKAST